MIHNSSLLVTVSLGASEQSNNAPSIYLLTGKSWRMTHVKKSAPSREEKSSLIFVAGFGISLTNSKGISVPAPNKNLR